MEQYLTAEEILQKEPLELMDYFNGVVSYPDMVPLDEEKKYQTAVEILNKATAFICYFSQLETAARIHKRNAKKERNSKENERYIGIEDVCRTFKEISKQQYDNVLRCFTAKRLILEEFRQQGKMI